LPCVERRSPAITTPPGYLKATIVVPCGNEFVGTTPPLATDWLTGKSWGA